MFTPVEYQKENAIFIFWFCFCVLAQVADTHTDPEWHMPIRAWILSLAVPLVPLGIIRSLRLLVPFSAIATAFILVGLGCTMSWVVTGVSLFADEGAMTAAVPLPDIGSRPWIAPVAHMPLFFATVLFAMEGIGTVSIYLNLNYYQTTHLNSFIIL